MSKGQRAIAKVLLAISLPLLTYWSTMNLPLDGTSWWVPLNNFLWIASAMYFVVYLPLRGLGVRHWVMKVMIALLAVSIMATAWQAAVKFRAARYEHNA